MRSSPARLIALAGTCLLWAGCGDDGTEPPVPVALAPSGAVSFDGIVGTALAVPPAVLVIGSDGEPLADVSVTFAPTGGGTVTKAVDTTDVAGIATVGGWTLGTTAGAQTLTATAGSLRPISFSATAAPAAPAVIAVTAGDRQTATVGAAVAEPLTVRVTDAHGNNVPNATVAFEVASGGGKLLGASALTNAQGIASIGGWILGGAVGANSVTARVGSVAPVTITATGTTAAAAQLATASGDGQAGDLGTALGQPLTARVTDAFGNPVADVPVAFAVTAGRGTLSVSSVRTDAQGAASTAVTLTDVGLTTVTATSAAITGGAAVFNLSTGPTVVGQVSLPAGPAWPFAWMQAQAARASARPSRAADGPSAAPLADHGRAAARVRSRGRVVVSFRPTSFGLPAAASAYAAEAPRRSAVAAYRAALAPHVQRGHLTERAVSPAIGAVLVEVAPGVDLEAEMAELRSDPRVLAVEEDRLVFSHRAESRPIAGALGALLMARPSSFPINPFFTAPATERYASDPFAHIQAWHYNMIDAPRAWARTTGSATVRIGVLDTGVRADHPALSGLVSMTDSYDFTDGVTEIFDVPEPICGGGTFNTIRGRAEELALPRNGPGDPLQVLWDGEAGCWARNTLGSHGTHVSGTIVSGANDAVGGTGVNWDATLVSIRVLGIFGGGFDFDIAQGILYAGGLPATYLGAPLGFTVSMPPVDVANVSLGGEEPATILENALAATAGNTLFVASAGNSSTSLPEYPSAYDDALAVVALDAGFGLAGYTNIGPHVDMSAPGGDFRLGSSGGVASSTWDYEADLPGYAYYSGTSMAAPHVTGVAALIQAVHPSFGPAELRERLQQGAVDLGPPGHDNRFGAGVVNAFRSVTGTAGPVARTTVRAIDASTGRIAKSATPGASGHFTFTNLADGDYLLIAGQDEGDDGLAGIPGRRLGWFGGASAAPIGMSGATVRNVSIGLGSPVEAEPNDATAQAQPLVVDSWVAGHVGGGDARDVYAVMIPEAGTYTFETSGVLGSCGYALEVNTVLRLLDGNGAEIAANDNTSYPTTSYPGVRCSLVRTSLSPGRHFVEVRGTAGVSGTYRLHVRTGS